MFLLEIFILFIVFTKDILAAPSIDNSTATTANFATINVLSVGQTTTAVIGDSNNSNTAGIRVIDDIGAGWDATMAVTNLTIKNNAKTLFGNNSTVNFTGVYDGLHGVLAGGGTFTVEITTGGSVGAALFKWTDPSGVQTTNVTTGASVILSNGITANFNPATYIAGDKWSIGVDVLPYTGLTVTPSNIYAEVGTLDGLTVGGEETLIGSGITSNSKTIMTASSSNGIGTYWQDLNLRLNVHSRPLSGNFDGTVTLTIL